MPEKDLATSTVLPNQGRILKQYTIDDVQKELKYFTELQSDKSAFIKGIEIRKEALKNGFKPIAVDGINKVINGITTLDELDRKIIL